MQHGASLPPSQLLKILTRGKTTRISADALLDFFQPLRVWLEQQNRNDIIGWNSNMDDVTLFKSLSGRATTNGSLTYLWIAVIHLCIIQLFRRQ